MEGDKKKVEDREPLIVKIRPTEENQLEKQVREAGKNQERITEPATTKKALSLSFPKRRA